MSQPIHPSSMLRALRACALALFALHLPAAAVAAPWFTRILDGRIVRDSLESGGAAWADLDGDGLPEAFVAHGNLSNQHDALYHNAGGVLAPVATAPMWADGGSSIGGTWGDFDGDGRLDLFVVNRNGFGNFLYRATGDTTFARVTDGAVAADRANANSASWVDVDGDGWLDLFVVNFQGPDDLYLNDGPPAHGFTAVDTGLVLGGAEFSIVGAWCDHDDDGDPDLFVGNAGTQNDYLYVRQPDGAFTRTTFADGRSTLGASWGDFDGDGDLDLFAASFQNQLSVLYANAGPPTWTLAAVAGAGPATVAGNAVGSGWGDFDNDGDLDLFVARDGQDNLLYVNAGPPAWTLARVDTLGVSADGGASFGCSWVDLDDDGDLDLFVANRANQSDFLYRNDGATGASLRLRLHGGAHNTAAIGARVRVLATIGGVPRWQVRDVEAQSGYNSQTLALHVGLGDATLADSVIVRWPSGARDTLTALAPGRYDVAEGVGVLGVAPPSPRPAPRWHAAPNPARGHVGVRLLAGRPGQAVLEVFDVLGRSRGRTEAVAVAAGWNALPAPAFDSAPGVYLLRLTLDGAASTRRIVRLP